LTNKESYITYCDTISPRLFNQPKWLDIVSPNWQVFKGATTSGLVFYLPYVEETKWGFKLIRNIPLCAYIDCLFDTKVATNDDLNEILVAIQQFARQYSLFEIDFSYDHALQQLIAATGSSTQMVTNLLDLKLDEQLLFNNINSQSKKYIKFSEKKIKISETNNWQEAFEVLSKSFERRNKKYPFTKAFIESICEQVLENKMGKLWIAKIEDKAVAVLFQVWDEQCSYYLLGGSDYDFKNNGAMAGLQWHAIKYAKAKGLFIYDFEGSITPGIHHFFNSFGTVIKTYPRIQFFGNLIIKYWHNRKNRNS
jgi:hypothetical protein